MKLTDKQVVIHLDKLTVQSIDSASGVFVGSNQAQGWSSHSKSNQGFGRVSDARIVACVSLVFDPDVIDSPIDDRDVFLINRKDERAESGEIVFDSVNATALNTNSSIAVGRTDQTGWSAHRKSNFGVGNSTGLNASKGAVNIVWDHDVIDTPIRDGK